MIKFNDGEEWKEIRNPFEGKALGRYAISNHGRMAVFTNEIKDGELIEKTTAKGYKIIHYPFIENNKRRQRYLYAHRLVAEYFLPSPKKLQNHVIHLDFNKGNNHASNLQWATRNELYEHHNKKNPKVIASNKKRAEWLRNMHIKKAAQNKPNRFYPGEIWKEITLPHKLNFRYAVSNFGRVLSFIDNIESGHILALQKVEGYPAFRYSIFIEGKRYTKNIFVRKLVAQYFLPAPAPDQMYVILLDHNRGNNRVENLKWATKKEMIEHYKKSPYFIGARLNKKRNGVGAKLTSTQVQLIKQKLADPSRKTRLKIIAKQFGVTTMTLQRIKTGENWAHVKLQRKPGQKYIENDSTNRHGLN